MLDIQFITNTKPIHHQNITNRSTSTGIILASSPAPALSQTQARTYAEYAGQQCTGSSADVLRDFNGSVQECNAKCDELQCIGFVRPQSGTYAGKCYFRGGTLSVPVAWPHDSRTCYIPQALTSPPVSFCRTLVILVSFL